MYCSVTLARRLKTGQRAEWAAWAAMGASASSAFVYIMNGGFEVLKILSRWVMAILCWWWMRTITSRRASVAVYNCTRAVILVSILQSCPSCVDPCYAVRSAIALTVGRIRSPARCNTEHRYSGIKVLKPGRVHKRDLNALQPSVIKRRYCTSVWKSVTRLSVSRLYKDSDFTSVACTRGSL